MPSWTTDFSCSVEVGQACTQAPHETHSDSMNGWSLPAVTLESKPRPAMVSANVPCTSLQARTHREQTMHLLGSKSKYGLLVSFSAVEVVVAGVAVADVAQPDDPGHVLQLAVAVGRAGQAVERVVGDVELHHAAAQPVELGALGVHLHAVGARAWCRTPACPCRPRPRPGTAGTTRTPRGCRWRRAWARRCRRARRPASPTCPPARSPDGRRSPARPWELRRGRVCPGPAP